ncbi:MAG TPA: proteasome subunit beta [Acidimicrobiales bacterium]|nr:proteasome subunit beta [Acidimicrobiales bacterium]
MGLPLFRTGDDPGPSFFRFAENAGLTSLAWPGDAPSAHATTVIAVRYVGGVVMVGDRQATSSYIASRDVRKIEPADGFTAIAMSGAAARGLEFIRMAQLSFEHYEKMTDATLSLEGKANYLSPIIQRNNLTTPLLVVPLLAGWDPSHQVGRIFEYDGAGGCYERLDFATIGSGSPFADNTLRLGFRSDLDLEGALELGALALYEAGDNDPSTGGPDFVREIFPMMVTLNADGFRELAPEDVAQRFRTINERRTESKGLAGGTLR